MLYCRRFLFVIWIISVSNALDLDEADELGSITNSTSLETIMEEPIEVGRAFPSVADIHPEVADDRTKVTWAHGVDSRRKLLQSLRGSAMMIEADVSRGKRKNDASSEKRPVMAHPPIKTSDLTLEEFLDIIIEDDSTPRGIKLDFKSTSVLEDAVLIIKTREAKMKAPLWLNADIVQGPVEPTADPIDPGIFLTLCKYYFPTAVISVGWTTKFGHGSYSFEQVRKMRDILIAAQITQPVTFPIRAGMSTSAESRENFLWLLNQIPKSTVTIWSSFGDEVNVSDLLDLIDSIGKNRVYIDVHNGLECQISRYRAMRTLYSWLNGSRWTARLAVGSGIFAFVTYVTCATSFLPWNMGAYDRA